MRIKTLWKKREEEALALQKIFYSLQEMVVLAKVTYYIKEGKFDGCIVMPLRPMD